MAMSDKLKKITMDDWRRLGFFYERNDESLKWVFVASKNGLEGFFDILEKISLKLNNNEYHDHVGPYAYLSIRAGDRLVVDKDGIRGSPASIWELARRIREELERASVGSVISLEDTVGNEGDYSIELVIRDYGFDPATEDSHLWQ